MKTLQTLATALALVCMMAVLPTATQASNNSPVVTVSGEVMLKIPADAIQNQLTIHDAQGNLVMKEEMLPAGQIFELNLSGATSGAYTLKFAYQSETTGQLVIKKKDFILN